MRILVTGAGGFVGHHLVEYLKDQGHWVRGVDIKKTEFRATAADEFAILDLRNPDNCYRALRWGKFDRVYHLAADMGGIGYITSHHAEIMRNNLLIDINMLDEAVEAKVGRFLFTSSACTYREDMQDIPDAPPLKEDSVYPALPEAAYGWEKLTIERLCKHYSEDYGIETRISRFHNVYGPYETWDGGREKAPGALSRKIARAKLRGEHEIEVWGDGLQRRSFVYIDDVVRGLVTLMESDYSGAVNIGQDRTVSINELAEMLSKIAEWPVNLKHVEGAQGVRGRNSDNTLAREVLKGWRPDTPLEEGLRITYNWIEEQVKQSESAYATR